MLQVLESGSGPERFGCIRGRRSSGSKERGGVGGGAEAQAPAPAVGSPTSAPNEALLKTKGLVVGGRLLLC